MSQLLQAPVSVRHDVIDVVAQSIEVLASPGATLTGEERVSLARAAREDADESPLGAFAHHLYISPATVGESHVRDAADIEGDGPVVETIGIVARLSAVDRIHDVLGIDPEPLPQPMPGPATRDLAEGLERRRAHVPMPPGPIPVTLDLVPSEGRALRAMFGPLYMTEEQMSDPMFHRDPGLITPQLETVAARLSLLNECFY